MFAGFGAFVPQVLISLVPLGLVALLTFAPYRRRLFVALVTFPRDIKLIYRFGKVFLLSRLQYWKDLSLIAAFRQNVANHPEKACIIFENNTWTFQNVEQYSNRVARIFQKEGFNKGDTVALMMENRPEFVCIWLGLAKLGVVTAFVNTNLRLGPLEHSLRAANCRAAIVSASLASAVHEVDSSLELFVVGSHDGVVENGKTSASVGRALDPLLAEQEPLPPENEPIHNYNDRLLYIYTSGTTGLPKAAIMLNSRFVLIGLATKVLLGLRRDDVLYDPLPQYHTAGGVVGTGVVLYAGLTLVMRSKFSASAYWPDCARHGCTVGQYIGEVCRYLLAVPPRPEDTQHRVRMMLGNGMRPQIWGKFVERFRVPQICELYGATEGNTNMVNVDNTVGAVGFLPRCVPISALPLGLIRVDEETGQPVRGADGLCQRTDVGEPGMCVGVIDTKNAMRQFNGYVDEKESKKKIICNVFKKGDQAFLSGDMLVMDEYGYLYFKDRTGDTFRWKGENVSTAEVEAVISNAIDLRDATVYGVEVPGAEGRAGMVSVQDPEGSLDLRRLAAGVQRSLPSYARPIFVRVTPRLEITGTFKIKKTTLQEQGFDPALIPPTDRLYMLLDGVYQPLTADLHRKVLDGSLRF